MKVDEFMKEIQIKEMEIRKRQKKGKPWEEVA